MLQVRQNMFETNSSSCNSLVVPLNQATYFSTIAESEGLDYLLENANGTYNLLLWLYDIGVEEIRYNGDNKDVQETLKKVKSLKDANNEEIHNYTLNVRINSTYLSKNILNLIIFGDETAVEARDDHQVIEDDNELVFLGYRYS